MVLKYIRSAFLLFVMVVAMTACAGSSGYMKPSEPLVKPDSGKALVYVFRPSGFGYAVDFQVWDGEKLVGVSLAKSYLQYMADPGKHIFMAVAENKSFVEADLAPNKTYYLVSRVKPGGWKARVGLEPVKKGSDLYANVPGWKKELNSTAPVESMVRKYEESYGPKIKGILEYYRDEYRATGKYTVLDLEDGE